MDWNFLEEKIKKKISSWSNRHLSLGGRVTLIRSILTAIPIYQLSFALLPKSVLASIRSIFCKFLWGGGESSRKISWVKWEDLCKDKNEGGLGLKNLESFNFALVGKWLWRFIAEGNTLWAKVVKAFHGDLCWDGEGFALQGNRSRRKGWWSSVVGLSRGEIGKGFREHLELSLGEGDKLLFWHHKWAGGVRLSAEFPRLFRLSTKQGDVVKNMGGWERGEWKWKLEWRRAILDRELGMVDRLTAVLNSVTLKAGIADNWRWKADPGGRYTVKTAYGVTRAGASNRANQGRDKVWDVIWKAPAPFKSILTTWRVLIGKLATCENLVKRNVTISTDEAKCVICKGCPESTEHLFFSCEDTKEVWRNVLKWLGVQAAMQNKVKDHFMSFINLGSRANRRFLSGIWIATVWCIWKWRNECRFNNLT